MKNKFYKILIACSSGMSTSILVNSMLEHAKNNRINVVIDAISESNIRKVCNQYDLVLIAPQINHLFDFYQKYLADVGIKTSIIGSFDFRIMDGGSVLIKAKNLIEKKEVKYVYNG